MAKTELDNKKYVVDRLLATKREGMDGLVEYMEEIGFFEAPCSGGNHLSCKYGLVHHTRHVMELAEKVGLALCGAAEYNKIHDSVMIAAALHDLGKCGQFDKPYYVPNMIKDGKPTKANPKQKYKQSESKPYEINKDLQHVDHCIRSVILATLYIDLTEDEQTAILYHDGLYGALRYEVTGHETPLMLIIHWADMWASRVVETKVLADAGAEAGQDAAAQTLQEGA